MIEYSVVKGKTLEELINKVNNKIKEGWTPLGGISTSVETSLGRETFNYYTTTYESFYQAMTKELKNK